MATKRRSKYTPGDFKFRVGRSASGKGLFTLDMISKGSCIIEYIGKPVSEEVAKRDSGKYLFELFPGKTIDGNIPQNLARYINHACAPNCEALGPRNRVFIYSLKNIPAGSELTYDYGEEFFNKHIQPHGGCKCDTCRPQRLG